jgi:ribonucleoside-diphosphate reductase alpha chain
VLTHNAVSPSVEPLAANAFTHKTHSGVFLVKNRVLDSLFKETYGLSGKDLDNVWQSVILNEGSVQHLEFLTDVEKDVFKTAIELNQEWIIEHAADRQPFIDQGQSINIFIRPNVDKQYVHSLHKRAWQKGLKALYYCRTKSISKTETISNTPKIISNSDCLSCEG